MAFSFSKFTGNGSNRIFNVPFPYLDRRHVSVRINGTKTSFTFLSNNSIQTYTTPAADVTVEVRRNTPNTEPLVDFVDGSTLIERDLDLLALQALFMNQEAVDLSQELVDELNEETDQDVKALKSALKGINIRAIEAVTSANNASAAAEEALDRAIAAENIVLSTSSQVGEGAASVLSLSVEVNQKAAAAAASATNALSSESAAMTYRDAAEVFKNAAANSAALAAAAANFNPDDFYTKPEADALLVNATFEQSQISGLDTTLAGKAATSHTHTIAQVSGLQTALDGKLGSTSTAAAASKLATGRSISLAGDVTGAATFDGSANVSITATIADDSHNHTIANIDGLSTSLAAKVDETVSIVAGSGLSGGGTLAASRTLTLGTPGSITATSTNSVTSTSHTHSITSSTIRTLMAESSVGGLGTYAALSMTANGTTRSPGLNVSGSNLSYCSFSSSLSTRDVAGTWELMGVIGPGSTDNSASIWLRVA